MKRNYSNISILCVALVFSMATLGAQNVGSILGSVSDSTGAVLPGVEIELQNTDTGIVRVVLTDDEGNYRARNLSLGTYRVSASLPGFQTAVRNDVVMTIGREAVLNLQLAIGEISEQVEVTGDAPLVETTSSQLSALVDRQQIADLPLSSRDFAGLIKLQAGITQYRGNEGDPSLGMGARISVSGARPNASSFSLDGTDITNPIGLLPSGISGSQLGIEAVREFKLLTSNYTAEYGRAGGAAIVAVSQSGTNVFHGSLYEYHRNDNLDAREFFTSEKEEYKQNQFGASVGGPLARDRAFFFVSYEGLRETRPLTFNRDVPSLAVRAGNHPDGIVYDPAVLPYLNIWPAPNGVESADGISALFHRTDTRVTNQDYLAVRMDYEVGNHSFFGRYTLDDSGRTSPTDFEMYIRQGTIRNQYISLEGRSILSPRFLNTASIGFARNFLFDVLEDGARVPDPSLSFLSGRPFGGISGLGDITSLSGWSGFNQRLVNGDSYQFNDDMTYDMGSHSLKFGAGVTYHIFDKNNLGRWGGSWQFRGFEEFLQNGRVSRFRLALAEADAFRTYINWLTRFYIQDDFRILPNLTLNLGLRYEYVTLPSERYGRMANVLHLRDLTSTIGPEIFKNPSGDDFAPRIGLAWDPTGSGDYSIRAGFGVFHDPIMVKQLFVPLDRVPPFWAEADQRNFTPGQFPNVDAIVDELAAGPKGIHFFESEPSSPYMMQWSLSFQTMLTQGLVWETSYAGSKGVHLSNRGSMDIPEPLFCGGTQRIEGQVGDSSAPAALCVGKADGTTYYPDGENFINPAFTRMHYYGTGAASEYHAWKNTVSRRFADGLQFQLAYTYGKTMDNGSAVISGELSETASMDPWNMELDWSKSDFHTEHSMVTNFTYDLPFGQNWSGVAKGLLEGWQVAGIVTVSSGIPFTATAHPDTTHDDVAENRASLAPAFVGQSTILSGGVQCNADCRYVNTDAFILPEPGFYGNLGRNTMIGPGFSTADFSILKSFHFGAEDGKRVQFRAEFFNIANHTNFDLPSRRIFSSRSRIENNAGRIRDTVARPRQVQLALRIEF